MLGMNSEHLPSFSLVGTIAVVTGASRGIGRGLVDALAAAGATVALTARSQDEADAIAEEVIASGGSASGHLMDVSDVASIKTAFDAITQQHGGIDVLVAPTVGGMHKIIGEENMDLDGESVFHRDLLSRFPAPMNQIGAPAIAAPIPGTGTPPVSVQLIGPLWGESRLLGIAAALETAEAIGRSRGSVQYRWQNFSAILDERGEDWLQGFAPLPNVGDKVRRVVNDILDGVVIEEDALPSTAMDRRISTWEGGGHKGPGRTKGFHHSNS